MASLLTNAGGGGGLAALFPQLNAGPGPALAHPHPPPQPKSAPPSPVKRHSVSVDRFCQDYDIDDIDCARLKEVGFRPGDVTKSERDNDLQSAGFTLFGWRRIHEANVRFKADLSAGKFDA